MGMNSSSQSRDACVFIVSLVSCSFPLFKKSTSNGVGICLTCPLNAFTQSLPYEWPLAH